MKQYFTGFFTATCLTTSVFIFMGSTDNNMGHIIVDSIIMRNPDTGDKTILDPGMISFSRDDNIYATMGAGKSSGVFSLLNDDNGVVLLMGEGASNDGFISTWNGKTMTASVGSLKGGERGIVFYGDDTKQKSFLGMDKQNTGLLQLFNARGEKVVESGASYDNNNNGQGYVKANDENGFPEWSTDSN